MLKNFDFSWFLTTPGILTCLGCLLILISIIIFLTTIKGGKKKKDETLAPTTETPAETVAAPVVEPNSVGTPVAPVTTPVESVQPAVEPVPVAPPIAPVTTPVEPVQPAVEPLPIETPVAPVAAPVEPVQSAVEPIPVETPVAPSEVQPTITPMEPSLTTQPEVAPIEITPTSINSGVEGGFAGINIEPTLQPTPSVEQTPVTEPKVVYGGADPLAGTGVLSSMEQSIEDKADDIESL